MPFAPFEAHRKVLYVNGKSFLRPFQRALRAFEERFGRGLNSRANVRDFSDSTLVLVRTKNRVRSPDFDRMSFAPIKAHRQVLYVNGKSLLSPFQ